MLFQRKEEEISELFFLCCLSEGEGSRVVISFSLRQGSSKQAPYHWPVGTEASPACSRELMDMWVFGALSLIYSRVRATPRRASAANTAPVSPGPFPHPRLAFWLHLFCQASPQKKLNLRIPWKVFWMFDGRKTSSYIGLMVTKCLSVRSHY